MRTKLTSHSAAVEFSVRWLGTNMCVPVIKGRGGWFVCSDSALTPSLAHKHYIPHNPVHNAWCPRTPPSCALSPFPVLTKFILHAHVHRARCSHALSITRTCTVDARTQSHIQYTALRHGNARTRDQGSWHVARVVFKEKSECT